MTSSCGRSSAEPPTGARALLTVSVASQTDNSSDVEGLNVRLYAERACPFSREYANNLDEPDARLVRQLGTLVCRT